MKAIWRQLLFVVAATAVATVVSCQASAAVESKASSQDRDVSRIEQRLAAMEGRLAELEAAIESDIRSFTGQDSLSARIDDLETKVGFDYTFPGLARTPLGPGFNDLARRVRALEDVLTWRD